MISKAAKDPERFVSRWYFTRSARAGWGHILTHAPFDRTKKLLLPAYIGVTDREGSGIFDPVIASGLPYTFYPVDSRLRPDMGTIERELVNDTVGLVLVVHYFGYCQTDLSRLHAMCREREVRLVEDCAHAMQLRLPDESAGVTGEYAFYSLHKWLAVPTGGILRINGRALPPLEEGDRCDQNVVEQFARSNIEEIATKRQRNAEQLFAFLREVEGIEPIYAPCRAWVPHDFPIIVADDLRERLYFELQEAGLPTIALYYRLIEPISEERYPVSHRLAKSILNLPVHQDTEEEDMRILVDGIASSLKGLRR